MTTTTAARELARQELFAWLQLAQQDLEQCSTVEEERLAEQLCDELVAELMAL